MLIINVSLVSNKIFYQYIIFDYDAIEGQGPNA